MVTTQTIYYHQAEPLSYLWEDSVKCVLYYHNNAHTHMLLLCIGFYFDFILI